MENKIRAKCTCGAVLLLTKTDDMEYRTYKCPKCQQAHHYSQFTILPPQPIAASSDQIIRVRCSCGAVLQLKNAPNISEKSLTCPVCHQKRRFVEFQRVNAVPKPTPAPNNATIFSANQPAQTPIDNGTIFGPENKSGKIAHLLDQGSDATYPLKEGENVVGRKAQSSSASVQIDTVDKRMSREHLVITAEHTAAGYSYSLRLFKKDVNDTLLNGSPLSFGNEYQLSNGDRLQFNQCQLIFVVE